MSSDNVFQITIRVYYEDTDAGGVVYHSNYLKFMERARSEWLRNLGHEQDVLIEQQQIIFAVKKLSIDFISPARFNDELIINTEVSNISGVSIDFTQSVVKENTVLAKATVQVVSLDSETLKPKRIHSPLKEELTRVAVC